MAIGFWEQKMAHRPFYYSSIRHHHYTQFPAKCQAISLTPKLGSLMSRLF